MITEKPFNISFSCINTFYGCERQFWYNYIKHYEPETSMMAYADGGNCVHTTLEQYDKPLDDLIVLLEKLWKDKKLDTTNRGMFNRLLKKEQYIQSIIN